MLALQTTFLRGWNIRRNGGTLVPSHALCKASWPHHSLILVPGMLTVASSKVQGPKTTRRVVARRTAKNSLEKPISLEKARTGRLHKYWPFRPQWLLYSTELEWGYPNCQELHQLVRQNWHRKLRWKESLGHPRLYTIETPSTIRNLPLPWFCSK